MAQSDLTESLILFLMQHAWPGDSLVHLAMRHLNKARLRQLRQGTVEDQQGRKRAFVAKLDASPRAVCTLEANQQHYELPPEFFEWVLGSQLKYSSALWNPGCTTLDDAEKAMLELYCERAQLQDGQRILDLGCGWGSLTLWMARRYPHSHILAVSNSNAQRLFILKKLAHEGLTNVEIQTVDINDLELPEGEFDRIVSVEMLEHVRNYREVFALLRASLKQGGKLFMHVFCQAQHPYDFDAPLGKKPGWMEKYFFSGGVMPSADLYHYFSEGFAVEEQWAVSGLHYQKTAEAWLANLRASKGKVWPVFREVYGRRQAGRWYLYWQLFFLACSGLFGYGGGDEWFVNHLRWSKTKALSR